MNWQDASRSKNPSGKSYTGLHSFLSISRIDAILMKATAMALRFSRSSVSVNTALKREPENPLDR